MSRNHRGKKVEEWEFTVNKTRIKVPVKIHTPEYADGTTHFSIDFSYGIHRFRKRDANIDVLRRDAREWLKGVVTYKWERYFLVEFGAHVKLPIDRSHSQMDVDDQDERWCRDDREVATSLEWRVYDLAENAEGKAVYRDLSKLLNNGDVIEGRPDVGENTVHGWRDMPTITALVKATPENEDALHQLARAFEALHAKLMKFLSPELIESSLGRMAGLLLPAPAATEIDHAEKD